MAPPNSLDLEGAPAVYQYPWTALIPMFTGPLSVFGCYVILRELWGEFWSSLGIKGAMPRSIAAQSSMRAPIVRCLFALSASDFCISLAFSLSTVPAPSDAEYIPFASGNFTTCAAQGFWMQMNKIVKPMFSTLLVFYYFVILKHQWTDVRIQRTELISHSAIWIVGLACSIPPIPLKLYNIPYHYCWLGGWPLGCETWRPDVPCERGGGNTPFLMMIFIILPLWPCLIAVTVMMFMIYHKVRSVENKVAQKPSGTIVESTVVGTHSSTMKNGDDSALDDLKDEPSEATIVQNMARQEPWVAHDKSVIVDPQQDRGGDSEEVLRDESTHVTLDGNMSSKTSTFSSQEQQRHNSNDNTTVVVDRRRSRAVARQAFWYMMAFVQSNILRVVVVFLVAFQGKSNPVLNILGLDIMLPLQGFWNALVMLNTRQELHTPEGKFFKRAVSWSTYSGFFRWLGSCCSNLYKGVKTRASASISRSRAGAVPQLDNKENTSGKDTRGVQEPPQDGARLKVKSSSIPIPASFASLFFNRGAGDRRTSTNNSSSNNADDRELLQHLGANSIDLYASSNNDCNDDKGTSTTNLSSNSALPNRISGNSALSSLNSEDRQLLEEMGVNLSSLDLNSSTGDDSIGNNSNELAGSGNAAVRGLYSDMKSTLVPVMEEGGVVDVDEGDIVMLSKDSTRDIEDKPPPTTSATTPFLPQQTSNEMVVGGSPPSQFAVSDLTVESDQHHVYNDGISRNSNTLQSLAETSYAEPLYQDDENQSKTLASAIEEEDTEALEEELTEAHESFSTSPGSAPLYNDSEAESNIA